MNGAQMIAAERTRQARSKKDGGEGWDAEHDRGHGESLAQAGAIYALPPGKRTISMGMGAWRMTVDLRLALWPWANQWWKPKPDDRIRELAKAGALIAAAIDSIQADQERSRT